jgi:hypothetical protein
MAKISVLVLADVESHADLGRLANAFSLAKEASQSGDQVEIVFDGPLPVRVRRASEPETAHRRRLCGRDLLRRGAW